MFTGQVGYWLIHVWTVDSLLSILASWGKT